MRAAVDGFAGTWQVVNRQADNGLVELMLRNERGSWFASPNFVTFLDGTEQPGKPGLPPAWRRVLTAASLSEATDQQLDSRSGNSNVSWTAYIRTELVIAGLMEDSGKRVMMDTGAKRILWRITDLGREELRRRA